MMLLFTIFAVKFMLGAENSGQKMSLTCEETNKQTHTRVLKANMAAIELSGNAPR